MARFRVVFAFALTLLALAALPAHPVRAAGKPLLVVMGASSRVKDISIATLRRVFLGMPTEIEGGKRFIPVNQVPGTPTRIQFDRVVLGLAPDLVGAFWIDRRIRDESSPPRTVPSAELAMRVVASLPGAITYLVQDMLNPSLRALTIDGKAAGQPDYLLK